MSTIAIIGRTNVGKSTLFNKMVEESKAMVSDIPGTTRDRNYGICEWRGKKLILIDTGGLDIEKKDIIEKNVVKQAEFAIKEASVILFIVDAKTGITSEDRNLARALRKADKPIILVANKADSPKFREKAESDKWKGLGFGKAAPVSAANGSGVGDLLDILVKKLRAKRLPSVFEKPLTKLIFLGKPNVGKSSIVNALLGEERVIVSNIPHTTREPEDSILAYKDNPFLLIDTAGIRKKAKVGKGLERMGVSRSIKALDRADVALLVLDATDNLGAQDKKLARLIVDKQKNVVVVVNKIDMIDDTKNLADYVYTNLPFLKWAPILFTSAIEKKGVNKILDKALEIQEESKKVIEPQKLESLLKEISKERSRPKVYKIKQTKSAPVVFGILIKRKETFPQDFLKFVENRIRREFKFPGVPIRVEILNIR
ncbi:MAG: ribosome biogenesis GTPase Der [Patescibacteria group bacterium]|nr:ribosome biogenesis GTPase Der [Patescibacteria group bacterium]